MLGKNDELKIIIFFDRVRNYFIIIENTKSFRKVKKGELCL